VHIISDSGPGALFGALRFCLAVAPRRQGIPISSLVVEMDRLPAQRLRLSESCLSSPVPVLGPALGEGVPSLVMIETACFFYHLFHGSLQGIGCLLRVSGLAHRPVPMYIYTIATSWPVLIKVINAGI
jgi:hypothetical protein